MKTETLIQDLTKAINSDLEHVKTLSMKASENNSEILEELIESERRLGLAKNRELMDDYQIKLAYRVSVKKIIQRLTKELSVEEEEI